MHDSLLCRAHDQWLGGTQSGRRRAGVACGDRLLDLADISAHLAAARPIDVGAALNFTDSLLGRLCVRHQIISWTRANARTAFHDGKPAKQFSKRKPASQSRKD